MANPFNPQFGRKPQQFVGRDAIINDFILSLDDLNDPRRTTIITGIRGSGKTAILSDVADSLDDDAYLVVSVTAQDGMLQSTLDMIRLKGKRYIKRWSDEIDNFSVSALGFGIGASRASDTFKHGFRYYLTVMLDALKQKGVSLVVLVDEVHNDTVDMREFVTTYQHVIREDYDVALLMAGLPGSVHAVLNDKILTFLRRAHRISLESIDLRIIRTAYKAAFDKAGVKVSESILDMITNATKGYPYLFQLIGFLLCKNNPAAIDESDAKLSIETAKIELFNNVHDIIMQELSDVDRRFLEAMIPDEQDSSFADIRVRMDVDKSYASKYRQRLIDAGIVKPTTYGKLKCVPPYMREYLVYQQKMLG